MIRTLMIVPRMYTRSEFREAISCIPDDYDTRSKGFWTYVIEKLNVFRGHVRKVFRESLSKDSREALRTITSDDEECYVLITSLVEEGAELKATEDPMLVAESESWLKMIRRSPNDISLEFYEQSLAERNRYVANRSAESLREREIGLLVIDSRRKLELPKTFAS